jgi:hypothetical protein
MRRLGLDFDGFRTRIFLTAVATAFTCIPGTRPKRTAARLNSFWCL